MHVECIPSMRGQDMMWAQECPMSLREHRRVILDLSEFEIQFSSFVFHSMSLIIDMKMIRSLHSSGWDVSLLELRWIS